MGISIIMEDFLWYCFYQLIWFYLAMISSPLIIMHSNNNTGVEEIFRCFLPTSRACFRLVLPCKFYLFECFRVLLLLLDLTCLPPNQDNLQAHPLVFASWHWLIFWWCSCLHGPVAVLPPLSSRHHVPMSLPGDRDCFHLTRLPLQGKPIKTSMDGSDQWLQGCTLTSIVVSIGLTF